MGSIAQRLQVDAENAGLLSKIYYAFFVSGMMSTLLGAMLPLMVEDYRMDYLLSGTVLSAHQLGNLCAVLIAGFLPYAIGRRRSTVFLCSGIVAGLILMTATGLPGALLTAFAATGVGRGTMSNISNVVISEASANKAGALNLLHAFFAVGALLSPFVMLLATRITGLGWRAAAWAVAALELAALALLWRSGLASEPTPRPKRDGPSFLRSFDFWLNTLILFCYLCAEASIIGWLVTFFKDSGLMSVALAQSTVTLLWVMVLVGRLICAACSARADRGLMLIVLAAAMTGFFLAMISTRSPAVLFPCLLGVGVSMAGIYPTTLSTMPPAFTCSTVATGTCIAVATTGAILMPSVVGAAAQRYGIAGGISTIGAALALLVALTILKYFRSRRSRPAVPI